MSSRSYLLAFLLSSVALAVGGSLAACTTETTVVQGGNDAASDAPREVSGPKDSGGTDEDAGQTTEECVAACEKQFAAGLTKDKAIDTCWTQKCDDPCNNNKPFDAGTAAADDGGDAGDAGDADAAAVDAGGPACMNNVDTTDPNCDLCTKVNCCQAWDDCFNDKDCSDLNDCRSACP